MSKGRYKRKSNINYLENANKKLHYIKGTKVEALTQKISKNNTTGTKGISVHFIKGKKYYRASIQLAKKRIEKHFNNIEKAILWRKEMEEKLYKPILEESN